MFLAGIVVFTVASLLSGLAWSEGSLIVARALQGLGAAIISPAALSILMTTFAEGKERNTALGAWGGVGAFGAVAGVLLGGVLTDLLSWSGSSTSTPRSASSPSLLTPVLLSESRDATRVELRPAGRGARHQRPRLARLRHHAGQQLRLGLARDLGDLRGRDRAARRLRRLGGPHAEPLMPFSIFRLRTLVGANVAGADPRHGVLFSMFLMLTLYMQQVLGYSPMQTGVAYLAIAGDRDLLVGARRPARHARGREAGDGRRHGVPHRRAAVLHAGVGGRLLRQRPAARVPADRRRDGLLVRADLDRRARGREAVRGRARVRAHQHVAADRRGARHRRALRGGDLDDRRTRSAAGSRGLGAHGRLPGRVHRRRGGRARRRPRRPVRRLRPRLGPGADRRARAGARGGLAKAAGRACGPRPVPSGFMRIGWIGTGVMGRSMGGHLLEAGYDGRPSSIAPRCRPRRLLEQAPHGPIRRTKWRRRRRRVLDASAIRDDVRDALTRRRAACSAGEARQRSGGHDDERAGAGGGDRRGGGGTRRRQHSTRRFPAATSARGTGSSRS